MEQLVINQLLTLLLKSGNDFVIKEFFKGSDEISKYKNWDNHEIENLLICLNDTNRQFSRQHVLMIIENLIVTYNVTAGELNHLSQPNERETDVPMLFK